MKLFAIAASFIAALAGVSASPYLEFCDLLDVQSVGAQGVVIQAACEGKCQQLNIVPCFANSYGTLVSAGTTNGNFNNTCSGCTLGTSKNDTETYGLLSCFCSNGAADVVVSTSYQTGNALRFETELGITCPYGNGRAVRSVDCGTTTFKHDSVIHNNSVAGNKRGRKVRRSMRNTNAWKT
ncbi:hypothetical protein JX265_006051 [Neoarthrinium moseri]|uniref:Cyanovirin-N domain-containing protein n=1 Tax=Neoarthrinium moseri TaxID=1658444 RepID=A0A9P9WME4_9PEZI|nr:uncharacterized protein JN550_004269 [Neoarthrinium moseri]KAI1871011.1 hypothetical protein JX265_006051 [Neoarthrinium moseri]KAI1872066.1 hypothetical protein JN550_004269 [Neoarthrinium moseri]